MNDAPTPTYTRKNDNVIGYLITRSKTNDRIARLNHPFCSIYLMKIMKKLLNQRNRLNSSCTGLFDRAEPVFVDFGFISA